jgi:hypothetical protein
MRVVVFLVLSLLMVAGCAERRAGVPTADEHVLPADFAGVVEYANGSVPPPYHYEWRVTFDSSTAAVAWRPGYGESTQPWRKTVHISDAQRTRLYGQLRDLGVFGGAEADDDGMVGGPGGTIEVTAGGRTYHHGSLGGSERSGQLLEDAADAVRELIPADIWAGLEAEQDDWGERQPK